MHRQLQRALGAAQLERVEWLASRAQQLGGQLWIVGGAVRDALLGRTVGDIDLSVSVELPKLLDALRRPFGELRIQRHEQFGTATLHWPNAPSYDMVECRGERYDAPGALPSVYRSNLTDDLCRRDFTIHAMAVEVRPGQPFRLIDPHGGKADLERGEIRALHEGSFRDDPTRAFRAARYAARLDFKIESQTARWMRSAQHRIYGRALSPNRRTTELRRIATEVTAPTAWRLLRRYLLGWAPPAVQKVATPIEKRVWLRRWDRLRELEDSTLSPLPSFDLMITLFAWPLTSIGRERIASMLELSRGERQLLITGSRIVSKALNKIGRTQRRSSVDQILGELTESQRQFAFLAASSSGARSILRWTQNDRRLHLEIDGRALLDAGIPPGPGIARGLQAARRAMLDRGVRDREGQLRSAVRSARSS